MAAGCKFLLSLLWVCLMVFRAYHARDFELDVNYELRIAPRLPAMRSLAVFCTWREYSHLCPLLRPWTGRRRQPSAVPHCYWLLLLAGDVERNPGPVRIKCRKPRPTFKFPCGVCQGSVRSNQRGIQCECCHFWLHTRCIGMSQAEYTTLQASVDPWCCKKCLDEALPFFDTSNSDSIFNTSTNSLNTSASCTFQTETPTNNHPQYSTPRRQGPQPQFNILSLNCRSLLPKIDHLRLTAKATLPHIISICETWLDNTISDAELSIEDYSLVRRDRTRHGGGIAIFVQNCIPFSVVLSHKSIEFLLLSLDLKPRKLLCGLLYRPPSSPPSVLEDLETTLNEVPPAKIKSLILTGDFNLDASTSPDPLLKSISDTHGLIQTVTEPTRTTDHSSTIIDHVYLSESLNHSLSSCHTLPPIEGSDHKTICVSLNLHPQKLRLAKRKVWLYKKADFDTANLTQQCIPTSFFPDDVDGFWSQWYDLFMTTMTDCIPQKNISNRRNRPYITNDVTSLIRKKERLYKQASRLKSDRSWSKYNKVRNKVTSALRAAKKRFFEDLSNSVKIPKQFWSAYHKLSPNQQRIPDNLSHNTETASSSQEKAELLNAFFSSCFTTCNPSNQSTSTPVSPPSSPLSSIVCEEDEVSHLLSTYKAKTSSGPDGISSAMLRNTSASSSPKLTALFNLSLREGKVPTEWKVSNITPIHKSGEKNMASNYRPISLLSLVSKVLERIIHNRVSNYLSSNKLLSDRQFGFRKGFSTQEALLSVTNDWHKQLSSNQQVAAVFFDLRKAFDSVPHHLITKSLSSFGISGSLLAWFTDYLAGRQQRVVLDGFSSSLSPVTSGVPQGSILGPLLFITFMDSLNQLPLTSNSRLILYADDIVLYKPINNQADLNLLQEDINAISKWTKEHGLSLNSSKTNILPITRSRHPLPIHLHVDNNPISVATSVKYLGVTLSSDLSWSLHVQNTARAAKRQLGFLHRQLYQATPPARHAIYKSVILPKLEYCASVWDPHQTTLQAKLESTQKFAGRVITKNWNADYQTLLSELQWNTLKTRRTNQKLKLCYKILNNHSCIPPLMFSPHPSPSPRHPHNQMLFQPYAKTNSHKSSFFIHIIQLWNHLPSSVVSCLSPASFKSNLSKHYPPPL